MAAILGAAGERVLALQAEDPDEVLGANTIAEMMAIDGKLRLMTARRLMAEGVTIFRPETTVIDAGVMVGADTVIEPFVQLLGETKVGKECRIRSYSVLEHATVGDQVLVRQGCIVSQSRVDDGALLGPYAHLRPESEIGEGAHVGNFVETKKIRLGKGSKAGHLTYLGDAEIGEGVNVGAGVITCNYDGVTKRKTVIGDQRFCGQRLHPGGTGDSGEWLLYRGGIVHHGRRAGRCAGAGAVAADHQGRVELRRGGIRRQGVVDQAASMRACSASTWQRRMRAEKQERCTCASGISSRRPIIAGE